MKKRTPLKTKTKKQTVKKGVRLISSKKKQVSPPKLSDFVEKIEKKKLPQEFRNLINSVKTSNRAIKKQIREEITTYFETRASDSKTEIRRALAQAKTGVYYNPKFRFHSYHPFGDKKRPKIWVDNFTGKKGVWRKWDGKYKLTPKGRIKKRKNPITGEMQEVKQYTSVMEKDYLKVAREMQIRILERDQKLNRGEAVIEYTRLAQRGRTYVFEQIGSRR